MLCTQPSDAHSFKAANATIIPDSDTTHVLKSITHRGCTNTRKFISRQTLQRRRTFGRATHRRAIHQQRIEQTHIAILCHNGTEMRQA